MQILVSVFPRIFAVVWSLSCFRYGRYEQIDLLSEMAGRLHHVFGRGSPEIYGARRAPDHDGEIF